MKYLLILLLITSSCTSIDTPQTQITWGLESRWNPDTLPKIRLRIWTEEKYKPSGHWEKYYLPDTIFCSARPTFWIMKDTTAWMESYVEYSKDGHEWHRPVRFTLIRDTLTMYMDSVFIKMVKMAKVVMVGDKVLTENKSK